MRAARTIAIIATVGALVGIGGTANAATTDAGSCTVSVSLPSKLVITSWSSIVTAELHDETGCASYASWGLADGTVDASALATFSKPNTIDRVSFYTGPSGNHAGSYKALASNAYSEETYPGPDGFDETVEVVQEDSAPMVAKYGSKLTWMSALRSGGSVILKAKAARYSPFATFGGYVTWQDAKVLVQKRVGSTWSTVKTVRTDRAGVVTARVKSSTKAWRLVTADSSSVWGKATGSKRR